MKNRPTNYYRHQRERAIKRKVNIIKNVWNYSNDDLLLHPWLIKPGKLSKGKLHCSCKMCKYEKHYQILKIKYKSKLGSMKNEIDNYLNKKECHKL